ncbi:CGNR zinc finger domain-containing protein [Dyella sp.]|jgi:predicted RNA-binding Zn ribbon-like protein|uniref:CGNR zinc finger domain-containing protein n=1 Tax=Dyella sp. TaxID=1869338 RepID=UPI002D78B7F4|nr:ABATE domain-containing protein [Dyella sp.]HET6432903.1 ABATE domain-containing protein [Dyella sp.]
MSHAHSPVIPRPVDAVRLDGGRLCLDFVNTIHDRYAAEQEDYLGDPKRFIAWSGRAGALLPADGVSEPRAAPRRAALMEEVAALRGHLHELFAARIDERAPRPDAVRGLDHWLHQAWTNQTLGIDGKMHWRTGKSDPQRALQRIALDALDLLGDPAPSRLRRCANTTSCGWLFLDVSKNGRRRWCAMETCGTAEKMQRYRRG